MSVRHIGFSIDGMLALSDYKLKKLAPHCTMNGVPLRTAGQVKRCYSTQRQSEWKSFLAQTAITTTRKVYAKAMNDRKFAAMHREFGKAHGRTCGECQHLQCSVVRSGRRFYKCRVYGISKAESTDWACRWDACMMIYQELPSGFIPLIDRLRHSHRMKNEPVDGQISMFEEGITNEQS